MTALRLLAALALPLALAGCGHVQEPSLSQRCGDLMRQAFPGAEIAVTGQQTLPVEGQQSYATTRIVVEGRRRKLPAATRLPRDVAAECRFDQGILTGFRWTKGPLQ
jgi:hypothetical protein